MDSTGKKIDRKNGSSDEISKTPIGQLLLAKGFIIPQDLEFALEHQMYSKELLGEILIRMRAIDREDLEHALGHQLALLVR